MTEPNAAIVEQYAEHLSGKAASSVLSFALVGTAGGAALGAIPGHLSHSLLANGVNYFAVLLGALAGGIAGSGSTSRGGRAGATGTGASVGAGGATGRSGGADVNGTGAGATTGGVD